MKVDYDYFLKEYHAFRGIMCSTEYSFEQKDDAYKGLLQVYIMVGNSSSDGVTDEDRETIVQIMSNLDTEFAVRMSHELFKR